MSVKKYFKGADWIPPLFICILLFLPTAQGCGDGSPNDLDSSLVATLQQEYVDYGSEVIPPYNAFTNFENSVRYNFWDGEHLINYGLSLIHI